MAFYIYTHFFFYLLGDLYATGTPTRRIGLEERETSLEGQDKILFLHLMEKMLQWDPEKRSSAKDLIEDPWLSRHI